MSASHSGDSTRDERLNQIIAAYLKPLPFVCTLQHPRAVRASRRRQRLGLGCPGQGRYNPRKLLCHHHPAVIHEVDPYR